MQDNEPMRQHLMMKKPLSECQQTHIAALLSDIGKAIAGTGDLSGDDLHDELNCTSQLLGHSVVGQMLMLLNQGEQMTMESVVLTSKVQRLERVISLMEQREKINASLIAINAELKQELTTND